MGETSSSTSHSRQDPSLLGYGFQGAIANSTPANFFDQGGGTYFGELEEALMHQVAPLRRTQQAATTSTAHHGDTKPFPTAAATAATATARPPPTLDIFPAWPMRSAHTPKGSNLMADSTDDSESSRRNNSNHSDQFGVAANMASQFDQVSQQQIQHKNMSTSSTPKTGKTLDPKTIRRLAQNREAARKSRLRKKAYIQQLESSKLKLAQMEQDMQRARSQGLFLGGAPGANTSSGAGMFDVEYARWLDENGRRMAELHGALHAHLPDGDLRAIVDDTLTHHDELFQLKAVAAKSDVFHIITGVWTTPAERCFLWMGGFRPSDLLKADNLRQQTLHQMHRILTVRQAARCFLAIGEYHNRLRALSSLWASRPREILVADEGNCGEISIAAQPSQSQFSAF
ncbi:hypothetical protein PVAP13_3KG030600 [Panicum virgatum]|uniref:Uncharacterized protein n=1 Tax=Panicum virgatum TaxID=38727 RepID=A0A8T0UL58_PANVG|nr:hypothetical protein PVAP13_3KG030600 [Panicum virgatum]